jgi:hypothetical protein
MKNVELKSSVYALIFVSALAWFGLAWQSGVNLAAAREFFGLIPKVVTVDLAVIFVFTRWGWKCRVFRGWLVPFPNLHGSWAGSIYSDWVNPETGETVPPIPVMLTVSQSFSHISCLMHTGEMKSYSFAEGFNIDTDKQIKQLAYAYTSKPRICLNQRSLPHDGAVVFDIVENPSLKLNGRYWTERKTKGEIRLEFHSKELLEELPEGTADHPVTEDENVR